MQIAYLVSFFFFFLKKKGNRNMDCILLASMVGTITLLKLGLGVKYAALSFSSYALIFGSPGQRPGLGRE